MTVQFLDTHADLVSFCQRISDSKWMTVDTEFLREKTYYSKLCLIQVATDDEIACIDPLAIDDLDPILDLIYNPEITVVFHAARQDLELFYTLRGTLPPAIFDTQLAATVLGYGDQIGYGNLVKQCIGVELDKAHSRTDWTKRPLDSGQISYAADDVRYLRNVYKLLLQELQDKNRLHWLSEDFDNLTDISTYEPDPINVWKKIKGAGRLKGVQLAILQKLADWREQRAINTNRPRRWVLKDEVMIDLAKLAPDSTQKFSVIRGLESGTIERHGKAILEQITIAKTIPVEVWPTMKKPLQLSSQQDATVDALMALMRKFCDEQSIAPAAVSSRKELERLVAGDTSVNLLQGWRNEIVGHHIQDFLNGKISITVCDTQLNTIEQG
jgi:ribonuclease D|tara:strand:+ start:211 stop:1362 length:1152 start_codon:yes stop_codon:yes gene_type:complete